MLDLFKASPKSNLIQETALKFSQISTPITNFYPNAFGIVKIIDS